MMARNVGGPSGGTAAAGVLSSAAGPGTGGLPTHAVLAIPIRRGDAPMRVIHWSLCLFLSRSGTTARSLSHGSLI